MDLLTLIQNMRDDGEFDAVLNTPLAQFGPDTRQYLGATLLPERQVAQNEYRELSIRYRTVIANDGSRYSPAQLKESGAITGTFLVELGNQDIAREFTGQDLDAVIATLERNMNLQAAAQVLRWFDTQVVRALMELNEKQRWNAIVSASVVRVGDNGYTETVSYPDPAGHRAAAGGTWTSDAYDPFEDIFAMKELLEDKGYALDRILTTSTDANILQRNENVQRRTGSVRILSQSDVIGTTGIEDINSYLRANDMPAIETYNLRYNDIGPDGITTERFLPTGTMVFLSETQRDENIAPEEVGDRFVPNVAGYTAIGRPVGSGAPGRSFNVEAKTDKPPRIEAQGWQTSLPVITEPESMAVVTGIE